jgi:hypothetical protein
MFWRYTLHLPSIFGVLSACLMLVSFLDVICSSELLGDFAEIPCSSISTHTAQEQLCQTLLRNKGFSINISVMNSTPSNIPHAVARCYNVFQQEHYAITGPLYFCTLQCSMTSKFSVAEFLDINVAPFHISRSLKYMLIDVS